MTHSGTLVKALAPRFATQVQTCHSSVVATAEKKTPKKTTKRTWLSTPMTPAQKAAIQRKARKLGISPVNYMRMKALADTDYDPDKDPDAKEIPS